MENWITVITCTFPHEANMVKSYLESNGIEVFLKDELTVQVNNYISNAVGGVKVNIKETDYPRGIELLKAGGYLSDEETESDVVPEIILKNSNTNTKICPFCSSENIGKKKNLNALTFFVYLILGVFFPIFRSSYKCFDCEKEWKYEKKKR